MTVSLTGLTLHVADVDRSLEFYRRLPAASVVFHLPGRFALLRLGQGRLGLLADRKRPFHVEFEVPDLDAAASELRNLGLEIDGPTQRQWGERDVLVQDPDGNLLEFAAAKSSREAGSTPLELFRRLTNGLYVVGVAHGDERDAFTAAWITQVSFEPLLLALSINPTHASYPILQAGGVFSVSVLGRGQLELARHFGTQSGRAVNKLAGQRWQEGLGGTPVLLDAAAYLECRVVGGHAAGDHQLVLGEVVGGRVLAPTALPMTYAETGNLDGSVELYPAAF
ncbi:MAG TPA: flavin reductase [Gemmatimonadales bacterium]|jgi:flavin reductase (DIM6/NTAB) family NADH-FMN oxidoreductase RutF/catechol 2,3-dioxygenase-like lactoylglutathione lyase family enzyme